MHRYHADRGACRWRSTHKCAVSAPGPSCATAQYPLPPPPPPRWAITTISAIRDPLLDLPNYPDDRGEWLESLSNNPGVRALNARVSSLVSPKVSLTIERLGLDRGVAILRELVQQTSGGWNGSMFNAGRNVSGTRTRPAPDHKPRGVRGGPGSNVLLHARDKTSPADRAKVGAGGVGHDPWRPPTPVDGRPRRLEVWPRSSLRSCRSESPNPPARRRCRWPEACNAKLTALPATASDGIPKAAFRDVSDALRVVRSA
jgi:hypothetical protein